MATPLAICTLTYDISAYGFYEHIFDADGFSELNGTNMQVNFMLENSEHTNDTQSVASE